jgi:multidrug resistance efflux pump
MSSAEGGRRDGAADVDSPDVGHVSFLDQALWKQLNSATTQHEFVRVWLSLQCRLIPLVERGVAVLEDSENGKFTPVAFWPDEAVGIPDLAAVVELALQEKRGIVRDAGKTDASSSDSFFVAYPIVVEEHPYGAVGVELHKAGKGQLRAVMRQLQWGTSWIEVLLRRERLKVDQSKLNQTVAALDLVATALSEDRFAASCQAVVTALATRLDCDQVSIGFRKNQRTRAVALSHSAQFGRRMNLIRDIAAAMDEAIDQESSVLYPPQSDGEYRITRFHAEAARNHAAGFILTIPLMREQHCYGALCFERPTGREFDSATISLCDCVAAVLGPLLEYKRRDDRWLITKALDSSQQQVSRLIGPRHFGRKLAGLLAAAVFIFFWFARDEFRVTSPAMVEGLVQRVIVAPFDGFVASEHVRPGETVSQGQVLATLDDKDLTLERLKWSTTQDQRLTEYNRALATRERADIKIIEAQIAQTRAQISLLDEEIARTQLVAPFDAIVVSGDLSQSIGAAVQRGQELFKIAPLSSYRVILEVNEADIDFLKLGQQGALRVSSLPEEPLTYSVERITPISEAKEGHSYFRVEAKLLEPNPSLRPGMEGIGKTSIEQRRLIWIWTHSFLDWLRLQIWKWQP